jgi:hypothetical protein
MGTLHEDIFTFMTLSDWLILIVRNISNKTCRKNRNTFYVQWHFSKYHAVYEIMSKNIVESEQIQTIWHLSLYSTHTHVHRCTRIHICMPSPTCARTYSHTQNCNAYCLPWQQWFCEHTEMLHYTYIASLVLTDAQPYDYCRTHKLFIDFSKLLICFYFSSKWQN